MESFKNEFVAFIHELQEEICKAIEEEDGKSAFKEELWTRDGGGGGRTRILSEGEVFEKGGVNISEVFGKLPPSMVEYLKVDNVDFFACGLSLVLHPNNPHVPTVHANYRYFELYNDKKEVVDQWFGGGSDLTPYYIVPEDIIHFHQTQKNVCDNFDTDYYSKYKKACDIYFYNHHRDEARGVGGLFYDHLRGDEPLGARHWFDFVTSHASAFIEGYVPIVQRRKKDTYTTDNKIWQELRRGRYVEFNLIHDKGTLFGLKTKGRIESILMSLPPKVRWDYNHLPAPDSKEEELINILKQPKDWLA
jgi:coproporphyrinogen III oxidase